MSPKKIALPLDIYVRVSDVRGRSGDSFISPKDQEERCRALARARGYKTGEVFTDLDVSGGKMRRPELDRAIARIEEGVSGGILVAKLDRFARTLVGGLQTLEQINELGGAVIVADGEFDTSTATGELVLNMMFSLAQFELRRIRETWVSSKRHAVERGIHVSRHAPPGYIRGDDRRLVLDPVNAEVIREAFSMAANREPYARIGDHLGIPSNRVKRLLQNRAYLGEARNGHGDVNPDAHPALVDEVTWNLAQRKQPDTPTLTRNVDHLLSGLLRCASCSFAMRPQAARGTTVAAYRCTTNTAHGRCPGPSTISASRVEDYVIKQFLAAAGTATFEPADTDDAERAEAEEALKEASRAYEYELANLESRDRIGDVAHDRIIATRIANLEAAKDRLAALIPTPPRRPASSTVDIGGLVERLQREDRVNELRELLGSAVLAVFVRPAASRQKSLPVSDRVKVVYHDSEQLELPRRGASYEPRAYTWQ